ncbi:uroporphyrinogen-III synthase [Tersicoccus sp. MR15.9]|uniref:uroporphyrinogen-III synthase n=1 Tax=Tersicoccus mangrovi TaxID=3121635 RepID=UPI002FE607AA
MSPYPSPTSDRPLAGRTIALTRGPARAGALGAVLREAGATVLTVPVVDFAWPADLGPLDDALTALRDGRFGWLAVTSATTVTALTRRAAALGTGLPILLAVAGDRVRIAAVGAGTAAALERAGVAVDLVPATGSGAQALLEAWPDASPEQTPVLLPHSDLAAGALADGLTARGWPVTAVTAYRTVDHPAAPGEAIEPENRWSEAAGERLTVAAAQERRPDAVVVTSPSTLRRWLAAGDPCPIVAIGLTTAAAAAEAGRPAAATAATADPAAVRDAVVTAVTRPVVSNPTGSPSARSADRDAAPPTPERRWKA